MSMNNLIKISKLAKELGISKVTLYNWKNKGKVEFVKSPTGRNHVTREVYNSLLNIKEIKDDKTVIYCRVSSTINKTNLESQKQRLINYCSLKGYNIYRVVEEFGSGINDKRPKLENLLIKQDFTRIVVEHKDRLTRFGFNYIEQLLRAANIKIEVVNNVETDTEDIIQDFISIITSYCARIYGRRRTRRKTEELIKKLKEDNDKNL